MTRAAAPVNEGARLEALRSYEIIDTPAEPQFDAIVRVAATALEVPIALLSFVDVDRQWAKARHGLAATQTARDGSFCGHVVAGGAELVVPDALLDARFVDHPFVAGPPGIRFYAGAPLRAPGGHVLGTVCVLAHEPRAPSPAQLDVLRELSVLVVELLEQRRGARRLHDDARTRRQADQRFRIVVEAAPTAMLTIDRARVITFVNRKTAELFGYARDELLGQPIELLVRAGHPGYVAGFFADPTVRAMGAGRELIGCRKDGAEVPIEIGLTPIETEDDGATLASIIDITERKLAVERFRAVIEASPNAILKIDRARTITFINRKTEELFGYARDELLGQPIDMLVPARYRTDHPGHIARFFAAPQARAMGAGRDLHARRKDGSEVPVEIGLTTVETATGFATLATIIDVTARRRAEDRLADTTHRLELATERFQLAATAAQIGVWDWDISNDVLTWDSSMHALYGTTPGAFSSAYEAWSSTIHPEDRADTEAALRAAVDGVGEYASTFRIIRPGGEVRHVRAASLVQRDPASGLATRVVGVNLDITDHKVAELELRRSNADLEQFANVASHDLQEPLRMVASYTELLAQRYRGKLDDKADKYIFFAVEGAKRMQRLIADLLAYSRVGSQGRPLAPVATGAVVHNVLEVLSQRIARDGATVRVEPLPTVLADEGQLHQLFQNLIGNALKFRGEAAPEISITARRHAEAWRFAVTDNGIGIEPKYAERIFLMFQRLHERGKYEGSGIGLAIARRIVERHGGRIWLEPAPGGGTTFCFTLVPGAP